MMAIGDAMKCEAGAQLGDRGAMRRQDFQDFQD